MLLVNFLIFNCDHHAEEDAKCCFVNSNRVIGKLSRVRVLWKWDGSKLLLMLKEERCYQRWLWRWIHHQILSPMLQVHHTTIFCSRDKCDSFSLASCTFLKFAFFPLELMHQIMVSARVDLLCIYALSSSFWVFNWKIAVSCVSLGDHTWKTEIQITVPFKKDMYV